MDNRYFSQGCPPLMHDGRFITNYTNFKIFEQYIRNINKIGSAQDYRKFLQDNGDMILNNQRDSDNKINTCNVLSNGNNGNISINSCGCN